MTQTELAAALTARTAQTRKLMTEIRAKDARIKELEGGGEPSTDVSPELEAAASDLGTAIQEADDITTDAPGLPRPPAMAARRR